MNEIETFYGVIETSADALRVLELCRQGRLGRVRRRLHENERKLIRSGSVFVFDEVESGIKRWTDGRIWSPSRILGNFLVYRELEKKVSSGGPIGSGGRISRRRAISECGLEQELVNDFDFGDSTPTSSGSSRSRQRSTSITGGKGYTFFFKPGGLIKKTMSVMLDGHPHHLVCYYTKYDATHGKAENIIWQTLMKELRKVQVPRDILAQQHPKKSYGALGSEQMDTISKQEMLLVEEIENKWSPLDDDKKPTSLSQSNAHQKYRASRNIPNSSLLSEGLQIDYSIQSPSQFPIYCDFSPGYSFPILQPESHNVNPTLQPNPIPFVNLNEISNVHSKQFEGTFDQFFLNNHPANTDKEWLESINSFVKIGNEYE
ncbi:hypothetical protein ROZALSC1DRAFT_30263 [Rozella allomycis CSF55]|uniref:Gluconate transport inducer 1/Pac2 domain-containing protein n=1 Tax=Rozella allomycis (strain CSF55) TaxID=988480 RepID=A0A075AZX5_ROZAC|nr:Gluconate transport inducer 1/Pac2 domain-containing protein [Rozella allomycis CSF55]RKP17990.1 hypothetical protein ROZALSC1DRAFT_30263 [Rozella allomycis CSF55]|eukprot:EPZ35896.1 Gluconate transport inducer 1/Pac2 domain-containing protein [Rozella allomycis CSF55]